MSEEIRLKAAELITLDKISQQDAETIADLTAQVVSLKLENERRGRLINSAYWENNYYKKDEILRSGFPLESRPQDSGMNDTERMLALELENKRLQTKNNLMEIVEAAKKMEALSETDKNLFDYLSASSDFRALVQAVRDSKEGGEG